MNTRIIIAALLGIMFSLSATAQTEELKVHLNDQTEKLFGRDLDGNKVISFYISGLNNEIAVGNFTEKMLKNDFVVDFSIISATFDGKRKAKAVFKSHVKMFYFQSLLQNLNVKTIVHGEEEFPVEELIERVENKRNEEQ